VNGAEGQPTARQGPVDRRDAERQDAMARRPLDLADPLAKRCEVGWTRHASGKSYRIK
jgi:hypothetical protein